MESFEMCKDYLGGRCYDEFAAGAYEHMIVAINRELKDVELCVENARNCGVHEDLHL